MSISTIMYKLHNIPLEGINTIDELMILKNFNDIEWLLFDNIIFRNRFEFPTNLKTINIRNCGMLDNLSSLPSDIENINITNCNWLCLDHLFMNDVSKVVTLDLNANRLKYFPENFPPNLVEFSISLNNVVKIPDENCFGPNITTINIANNKIEKIPQWFRELNTGNVNIIALPNWKVKYEDLRGFDTERIETFQRITHTPFYVDNRIKQKTTAEHSQNVHNGDIQKSFAQSVNKLLNIEAIPIDDIKSSVFEYYVTRNITKPNIGKRIRSVFGQLFGSVDIESSDQRFIKLLNLNLNLSSVVQRCGVTYFEIFKKIWEITETHEHKEEMRSILRHDIWESKDVCFTGKVTKMVNSMSGFIPEINIGYSENEQINNIVIMIMRKAEIDSTINIRDEVKKELDLLKIDEEKQKNWLDAL
jgi:hypothetical protein